MKMLFLKNKIHLLQFGKLAWDFAFELAFEILILFQSLWLINETHCVSMYSSIYLYIPDFTSACEVITDDCEAGLRGRSPEIMSGCENILEAEGVLGYFLWRCDMLLGGWIRILRMVFPHFLSLLMNELIPSYPPVM